MAHTGEVSPAQKSPEPDVPLPVPAPPDPGSRLRRRVWLGVVFVALLVGLYYGLPKIAGLQSSIHRISAARPQWLAVGVVTEAISIGGYIALFRYVLTCHEARINWRSSYEITMAGIVATKVFATAGAGGIAVMVWALRASGLAGRTVARRMVAFNALLYGVFMGALVFFGFGLFSGVLAGRSPTGLTLAPAVLASILITLAIVALLIPQTVEERLNHLIAARRRRPWLSRVAAVPAALHEGTLTALELLRKPSPWLGTALVYWGFDIATLWASFHAFGSPPTVPILVIGYFVGQLGNTLPLPGGIGGVEGGMIGAFIGFGTSGSLAVIGVLTYRLISYWLPMLPGAVAYLTLRRTVGTWRSGPAGPAGAPASGTG